MNEEEIRALKELGYDLKEHKTKYAKDYEDVCYSSLIKLQQENTQLKQQLKDKDEKINKIIEYIEKYVNKELEYLYKKNDDFHKGKDFGDGSYGCAIQDVQAIRGNILEILESNKED